MLPYPFGRGRVSRHGNMFGLLPLLFRRMRWHCLKVKGGKEPGRGKESRGNGIFSALRLELLQDLSFLNTCLQNAGLLTRQSRGTGKWFFMKGIQKETYDCVASPSPYLVHLQKSRQLTTGRETVSFKAKPS